MDRVAQPGLKLPLGGVNVRNAAGGKIHLAAVRKPHGAHPLHVRSRHRRVGQGGGLAPAAQVHNAFQPKALQKRPVTGTGKLSQRTAAVKLPPAHGAPVGGGIAAQLTEVHRALQFVLFTRLHGSPSFLVYCTMTADFCQTAPLDKPRKTRYDTFKCSEKECAPQPFCAASRGGWKPGENRGVLSLLSRGGERLRHSRLRVSRRYHGWRGVGPAAKRLCSQGNLGGTAT